MVKQLSFFVVTFLLIILIQSNSAVNISNLTGYTGAVLNFTNQSKGLWSELIQTTITEQFLEATMKQNAYTNCQQCLNYFSDLRIKAQANTKVKGEITDLWINICQNYNINISVCQGYSTRYLDLFISQFIMHQTDGKYYCGKTQICLNGFQYLDINDYAQEVLKGYFLKLNYQMFLSKDKPAKNYTIPAGKNTYKLLHLTDIHLDVEYAVNTTSDCADHACCRKEVGYTNDTSKQAQYWGTVAACDIPPRTAEEAIKFIANEINPDILIWTGDNNNHAVWSQVIDNHTVPMQMATNWIKQYMPKTTPIYPIWGNHEDFPVDDYDVYGNASDFLKDIASEIWTDYLDAQALSDLKNYGYYSMNNSQYNIKFIVLQTACGNNENYYVQVDRTDPLNQLEWLRNQLDSAEKAGQDVIIMGQFHLLLFIEDYFSIPMSTVQSSNEWGQRLTILTDRYTNIIKGQFFGHTHQDQLSIVRSWTGNETQGEPVGVYFIDPSITTFAYKNPSFKVYEYDKETNNLINVYTYRLNLTNYYGKTTGPLIWDIAYDFQSEYNINKNYLTWDDYANVIESFETNLTVLQKYAYNYYTGAEPLMSLQQLANKSETLQFICQAKYSFYSDILKCYDGDFDSYLYQYVLVLYAQLNDHWYIFNESLAAQLD